MYHVHKKVAVCWQHLAQLQAVVAKRDQRETGVLGHCNWLRCYGQPVALQTHAAEAQHCRKRQLQRRFQ